jgi:hypothetical protein
VGATLGVAAPDGPPLADDLIASTRSGNSAPNRADIHVMDQRDARALIATEPNYETRWTSLMCSVCGSAVVNRAEGIAKHTSWHEALAAVGTPEAR